MLSRFIDISQEFNYEYSRSPSNPNEIEKRLFFDLFKGDIKDYQICQKVVTFPKANTEYFPWEHSETRAKRIRYDSDVKIFYSYSALSTRKTVRYKIKTEWEQLQLYVLKHYYPSWGERFVTRYTLCQRDESLHLGLDIYSTYFWAESNDIQYILNLSSNEEVRKRLLDFQCKIVFTMISNQLRTVFDRHVPEHSFPIISVRHWLLSPTEDVSHGEVIAGLLSNVVMKDRERLEFQIHKFQDKCAIKIVINEMCYKHYLS